MEISPQETAEQLSKLLKNFIRLRPRIAPPEHMRLLRQEMEGLYSGHSTPEDYEFLLRVFIFLADSDIPPTMGELSECLEVPLSTATRIVDWLVRADLVMRIADPSDRRVVRVQMTEKGQQSHHFISEFNKQRIANLLKDFTSEEQQQLLNLAGKLLDAMLAENQTFQDGGSLK